MAKLTGDLIKAGMSIWVIGYERGVYNVQIPVELTIVDGVVKETSNSMLINFVDANVWSLKVTSLHEDTNGYPSMYLGDQGVRPYAYDNRCTQVFTTKEEVQALIDMVGDRNPNFVDEEGSNIQHDPVDSMDYLGDDYDYE